MKNTSLSTIVCLTFAFFFTQSTFAQFTVSGELRPRAEYRHGFKALADKDQDAAFFIDQRSRINFGLNTGDIETYLSLQDYRVWGDTRQLVVQDGSRTSLHQGWAKIKFKQNWALKLGRQELAYDDQRILGSVGWAQQARSHDAALITFQDSTFKAHVGLAFNQQQAKLVGTVYELGGNYKAMQFLWLNKNWGATKASFLFLNNGLQVIEENADDNRTNFSQTVGARIGWKKDKAEFNIASYYQGGKVGNETDNKISAYYFALDASYLVATNFNLTAGLEMLSGNDQLENSDKNKAFAPLYGTNHKFNGLMDYFYVGNHANSVGLNDIYLTGKYKKSDFNTSLSIHFLMANNNINDGTGKAMDNYLGTEIDYNIGFNLTKGASVKVGYSQMLGSDSMVALRGGDTDEISNWFYTMVTVKPSFTFKKN